MHSPFPAIGLDVGRFRPFSEYVHGARVQSPIPKHEPWALLVRYLFAEDSHHYRVMVPATGQILRCRSINYRNYNPMLDPTRLVRPLGKPRENTQTRVNAHHLFLLSPALLPLKHHSRTASHQRCKSATSGSPIPRNHSKLRGKRQTRSCDKRRTTRSAAHTRISGHFVR